VEVEEVGINEEELARETLLIACSTLELVRAKANVPGSVSVSEQDLARAERNVDNAARLLVGTLDD